MSLNLIQLPLNSATCALHREPGRAALVSSGSVAAAQTPKGASPAREQEGKPSLPGRRADHGKGTVEGRPAPGREGPGEGKAKTKNSWDQQKGRLQEVERTSQGKHSFAADIPVSMSSGCGHAGWNKDGHSYSHLSRRDKGRPKGLNCPKRKCLPALCILVCGCHPLSR